MARILVIDDEPMVREFVRIVLERDGHDVEEAANGQDGLDAFEREPADLAIVDLIMPRKDGIETIRELRALRPHIPIVVVTGAPPARWPIKLLYEEPAEMHILAKPMTEDMILETTREALEAVGQS